VDLGTPLLADPDALAVRIGSFLREFVADPGTAPLLRVRQCQELAAAQAFGELLAERAVDRTADADVVPWTMLPVDGLSWDGDSGEWTMPAPAGLVGFGMVQDRVSRPRLVLVSGLGVALRDGQLRFARDPRPAAHGPLWLQGGRFDRRRMARLFGAALGTNWPSSGNYLAFVRAAFEALARGPGRVVMARLVAAWGDAPVATFASTVRRVTRDRDGWEILTDHEVLRSAPAATPTVAVGDVVRPGQHLDDALETFDLRTEALPARVPAVGLPAEFLGPDYQAGLAWPNFAVPTYRTPLPDGGWRVRWPLLGRGDDQWRWWTAWEARAAETGWPAARLVDVREESLRTGTDDRFLPATVVPAATLAAHDWQNDVLVLRVVVGRLGAGRLPWRWLGLLDELANAGTFLLRQYDWSSSQAETQAVAAEGGHGLARPLGGTETLPAAHEHAPAGGRCFGFIEGRVHA